jgi:DNA topoisomerase-1
LVINTTAQKVKDLHGEKYLKTRQYKTKSKGAQEAHEAIRPTYIQDESVPGSAQEKRLYELIWKRTLASQMEDALLEKTVVTIDASTATEKFTASGEVITFDGFLKVYMESTDEDQGSQGGQLLLPPVVSGNRLTARTVQATERFAQKPPRFTEASLVKRLEELGIGRPSTYAPTITTIQNRNYVVKEDRPGKEREFIHLELVRSQISRSLKSEITGAEKAKLFPTDIGMVVTDFLNDHFGMIMDYNFTASVEMDLDEIAEGNKIWFEVIDQFYKPFHIRIEEVLKNSEKTRGERILGIDPATGRQVAVKIGRYGPIAQLGEASPENEQEKPQFASLRPGMHIGTISLEEALELFKMPRNLGEFEGKSVTVGIGRFGPYVRHNSKFISLSKSDDPYTVTLERAEELIGLQREKEKNAILKRFEEDEELKILKGRFGPYIVYKKENYRIPKGTKAEELTFVECMKLVEAGTGKSNSKKKRK